MTLTTVSIARQRDSTTAPQQNNGDRGDSLIVETFPFHGFVCLFQIMVYNLWFTIHVLLCDGEFALCILIYNAILL